MRPLKEMPNAPADSLRRKAQDAARGLYSAVDALRWEFRKADGFSNVPGEGEAGPMEAMLDQILGGEQRVRERVEAVNQAMAPHLVHLADSVRQWEKRYGKQLMLKDAVGGPWNCRPACTGPTAKNTGRRTWSWPWPSIAATVQYGPPRQRVPGSEL